MRPDASGTPPGWPAKGVKLAVKKIDGKAASQALREQAAAGWTRYRSYSAPGGIRDELVADRGPLPAAGQARHHRPHRAGQADPGGQGDQERRARPRRRAARRSLYVGAQHAREWITRRDEPAAAAPRAGQLRHGRRRSPTCVNTTELWFVPVANPDGYDYTFTAGNRLWRKNLRDNNGDGQITAVDGVDLNRNFAYQVGLRQRGLLARPDQRHLPRPGPELRAGDPGARRAVPAGRLRVLHQLPLGRRAAALRHRLAGQHADARTT